MEIALTVSSMLSLLSLAAAAVGIAFVAWRQSLRNLEGAS